MKDKEINKTLYCKETVNWFLLQSKRSFENKKSAETINFKKRKQEQLKVKATRSKNL